MKRILYNESKLKKEDINHEIKRAKLLLINDNDEFMICHSYDTYHIVGGHVHNQESDQECIIREVKEEAGIILEDEYFTPLMEIKYYCQDYPEKGMNTAYINHYYYLKTDKKPTKRISELTIQLRICNENYSRKQLEKKNQELNKLLDSVENIVQAAIHDEKTAFGQMILKQLADKLGVDYE